MRLWGTLSIIILSIILCGFLVEKESNMFRVPVGFPAPVYDFKNNPVTPEGFALGRHLFYDPILSKDSSIACDNCHEPYAAFANLEHRVSHGMSGCLGDRNALPLSNLVWQKSFMWDGGVNHIEVSPLNALLDTCEMDSNLDTIVTRLRKDKQYPAMFQAAFGSRQINSQKMLKAISQFLSMLVSSNSKYDKHVRKEPGGEFSQMENEGYLLFKKYCNSCHAEPLFTDFSYRNNGLDEVSLDSGRYRITGRPEDIGLFKVPSLRNVALTFPYMHDGRFSMLNKPLEHYAKGVKNNRNLDPLLRQNGKLGFPLTSGEIMNLTLFLKTLTDTTFVRDKRFAKPADIHYANQIYF